MCISHMPPPIILPWKSFPTQHSRAPTCCFRTMPHFRSFVDIIDVPAKIFGCSKSSRTMRTDDWFIVIALMPTFWVLVDWWENGRREETYLYSARLRKLWLQDVNTGGVLKVGATGDSACGSDIMEAGVVKVGSSRTMLLEVARISLSSTKAVASSEEWTALEPIYFKSVLTADSSSWDSSPYHLPR